MTKAETQDSGWKASQELSRFSADPQKAAGIWEAETSRGRRCEPWENRLKGFTALTSHHTLCDKSVSSSSQPHRRLQVSSREHVDEFKTDLERIRQRQVSGRE